VAPFAKPNYAIVRLIKKKKPLMKIIVHILIGGFPVTVL
jgi:hypothetical protein